MFSCVAYAHVAKDEIQKLETKTKKVFSWATEQKPNGIDYMT